MTDSFFAKMKRYGAGQSFFRLLHRLVSNFDFHPAYLYRKYVFGYAIRRVNGVKMFLDLKNDEGISKFIMIYGKREPVSVDHLLSSGALREGDIALDLGANIGYYALLESRLVGTTGKVYAIEPVVNNFKMLMKNIVLNGFSNIATYNMAAGDADKEKVQIYRRSKGNLSSLTELSSEYGEVVATEEVKLVTVDTFARDIIGQAPHYLRMDVEGYELAILEGMPETLKQKPCLQIEFHPMLLSKEQKDRIYEILKPYYSKVVITFNPKPGLGALILALSKKIGDNYHAGGSVKETDVEGLHLELFSATRVFNAFIG